MKDLNRQQAAQWVAQELAKHHTSESVRQRISSEKAMLEFIGKSPALPNSGRAHQELHDQLVTRLASLEAAELAVS